MQNMSIVVSGSAAVGKTTLAHALAKEFGLKLYNGGDILKENCEATRILDIRR